MPEGAGEARGWQGRLVDFETGIVRRDHVLVQSTPGAVIFLGFGPRAARLRRFAFGEAADPDPFLARCHAIAEAAEGGRIAKAQQAGVPLAILDIEDRVLRRLCIAEALAKAGYDPDEPRDDHGRWTDGGGDNDKRSEVGPAGRAPIQLAQEEDEDADPGLDDLEVLARQRQWDKAIATLRTIDPANPNLTYVAPPGAPSQAALDYLETVLKAATIKRITDKVMPGGHLLGIPRTRSWIRGLPGGSEAAEALFNDLKVGGEVHPSPEGVEVVKLPGNAGYITFRQNSSSGDAAVDVNVPGAKLKFHFP